MINFGIWKSEKQFSEWNISHCNPNKLKFVTRSHLPFKRDRLSRGKSKQKSFPELMSCKSEIASLVNITLGNKLSIQWRIVYGMAERSSQKVYLFNCDKTYNLDVVEKFLLEVDEKHGLDISIEKFNFRLNRFVKTSFLSYRWTLPHLSFMLTNLGSQSTKKTPVLATQRSTERYWRSQVSLPYRPEV